MTTDLPRALVLDVGDEIHGFASGCFGRDSYTCRVVEAVGFDWVVTRNKNGVAEFAKRSDLRFYEPMDRSYCHEDCRVRRD